MSILIPNLQNTPDLFAMLKGLPLAPEVRLAIYLKSNYGGYLSGMTDEDWMTEALDLLEAIGER